LAAASNKPAFLIFMAGPPRAPLIYQEAGQLVEQFGLKVAPVMLPERAAFHHSVGAGKTAPEIEPHGKAAEDVASLWGWICECVNMPSRKHDNAERGAAAVGLLASRRFRLHLDQAIPVPLKQRHRGRLRGPETLVRGRRRWSAISAQP
jgi:hypothetical protein